ncbi:MAG TPA: response regulator [Thermoanaerobaculia bacterium]|nr:response regulator [Thermoanaerobaculia bacterium]
MNDGKPVVCIVDDDPSVRKSLSRLLHAEEFEVRAYARASEFLAAGLPESDSCLLLDLFLPDIDGLKLQEILATEGRRIAIVFISGRGDVPSSVRAMKGGAIDFLPKPIGRKELLEAIDRAIASDHDARRSEREISTLREKYDLLTPREREVLSLVVSGCLNKQAASRLEIAEKTIKVHRAQVMRKMEAGSLADLVRMASRLELQ